MTRRFSGVMVALAASAMIAGTAEAQEWRGTGRVGGFILDENRQPVADVTVKAILPSSQNRGPEPSKSRANGEWAVGGLSRGTWALDFMKEGYETRSISVPVSEVSRLKPLEIILKKAVVVVDDRAVMQEKLTEAAGLMNSSKFAAARAIYETLAAENPTIKEFKPLIARAYYGEGDKEKAIALLREASTDAPDNVEVRLLLGTLLMEAGKTEEARTILATVSDAKVEDPTALLNIGIGIINEGKHADAIPWFDKVIMMFPDRADAYYYRGLSHLAIDKRPEAKADLEKFVSIAPADAPELATAKAMLESIK